MKHEKLRKLIDDLKSQPGNFNKFSQRTIAEATGIHQPALSDHLRYGKPITEEKKRKIAEYLGIEFEEYFD